MSGRKITDLRQINFTSEIIDNCFYVDKINTKDMAYVPMSKVFEWIKDQAIENGLTVELKCEQIIFIKHESK